MTPAVAVMAVALFLLGGLVADGGRQLNARNTATATAEEAARAGAAMLEPAESVVTIDQARARDAIEKYCSLASAQDEAISCELDSIRFGTQTVPNPDGGEVQTFPWVQVDVTVTTKTIIWGMLNIDSMTATGTGRAVAYQAVNSPFGRDPGLPGANLPSPSVEVPTVTFTPPVNTSGNTGPAPTAASNYPTQDCEGKPITLPATAAITCQTKPNPDPPPPSTVVTKTVPTSMTPSYVSETP